MLKKGSRYRTLILIAFLFGVLIALSYITGTNNRAKVIHKILSVMTNNGNNTDASKALEAEAGKQAEEAGKQEEEARKKVEEAAKLELWKQKMESEIKNYFGEDISKVGIVYYDINRNQKIAVNEEKVFTAASTVKVQMNMIAYDWVKEGKLSLDENLKYVKSKHWEAGTGILQGEDKSEPISVQKLLDYSIIHSDNIATRMIMERLGSNQNVRAIANKMAGTNNKTAENKVTAEQEFRLLKILYENREDKYYTHLIDIMKNTSFHDRLDKYVPQDIVAHKIGDYSTYVNDVGIIFTENPYILVVYTNELPGLGEFKPHEKIAGLSKIIYEAHIKK
jgi:beta-lactamase class A